MTKHTDQENNISYEYQHDLIGRVSGMKSSKGQRLGITYDDKNRIRQIAHKADGANVRTGYVYGDVDSSAKKYPGLPYGVEVNGVRVSTLEYDSLARVKTQKLHVGSEDFVTTYGYAKGGKDWHTTTLPDRVTHENENLYYTYDDNGNIVTICDVQGLIVKGLFDYSGSVANHAITGIKNNAKSTKKANKKKQSLGKFYTRTWFKEREM